MFDRFLYWLAFRFQWTLAPIIYRFRCPYPIIKDHSVRACIAAGHCGCNNGPPRTQSSPEGER